jgi:lycopene beta-cyclase
MEISIVGTGVSALLLAQSFVRRNDACRVRVFGPSQRQQPHILSIWSDRPTPFDAFCISSWNKACVVAPDGRESVLTLARQTYRTFRAQLWADAVVAELSDSGRVSFVPEFVTHVEPHPTRPSVTTVSQTVASDWVFTSVHSSAEPTQTQEFVGCEFELSQPIEHDYPRLLDFRTEQAGDFRFMYTLPLGERHLFVEHVSYRPCDHQAAIRRYMTEVLKVHNFTRIDSEGGATKLFRFAPTRRQGRVVHIGVGAGMAKPATGYAVMRMWRDAETLVRSLAQRGEPRLGPPPRLLQSLADQYFLDLMAREPARLTSLLSTLFQRAPGDVVLAFLDDQASLGAQLRVALAMPEWFRWLLHNPSAARRVYR